MGHRMLPRTTQQSHSAAPWREPQIEPWLAMLPPRCLSALRARPNERQVDLEMRGDANNAIRSCLGVAGRGWMPRKQNLPAKGKVFLLDIPFYRTRRWRDLAPTDVARTAMPARICYFTHVSSRLLGV